MKLISQNKLLVIVGTWNRNIFSKEWIKKYLLPKDGFTMEFSLDLVGSHRISSKNVNIEFHSNKLNFIPKSDDIEVYEIISGLAVKIADYLPHTPVFGYGINFKFEGNANNIQHGLITTNDVEKLVGYGAQLINSQHRHSVKIDDIDDILVNISITMNNDRLYFDFNFHSDITNLTQFKEKIYTSPIKKLHSIALDIMSNAYQVQIEGE